MQAIRQPAVAGLFYPGERRHLQALIRSLLDEIISPEQAPKALIAPHAGYVYSGPIAASAYACLASARSRIKRVVLLGPAHRVGFQGLAVSGAAAFLTPLGEVPVDREAVNQLLALPFVYELDQAHEQEHSLEVQLPFLQESLDEFSLVPLVVGSTTPEEVREALDLLWGGDETLIVVSSDLSHYEDYETARSLDAATSRAIEALRPQDLDYDSACGRLPIAGLLLAARERGLAVHTVDLRNSGDTAGSKDRVVGYGAYVLH